MPAAPIMLLMADPSACDRRSLRRYLELQGFSVREAEDGRRLVEELDRSLPDLVLLDLQLPPFTGLAGCKRVRHYGDLPIVVLTGVLDERIKLEALELYAEDYLLKPASYAEVAVRIRRILRRSYPTGSAAGWTVRVDGSLSVDFLRREAHTPEGVVHLTPLECRLLELLLRNAGQVLPNGLLLERLWGDTEPSAANLWEYVRRVRRKIGDDGSNPRYVLNEPGLGYGFTRTDSLPNA